jgi:hypothetical protein
MNKVDMAVQLYINLYCRDIEYCFGIGMKQELSEYLVSFNDEEYEEYFNRVDAICRIDYDHMVEIFEARDSEGIKMFLYCYVN